MSEELLPCPFCGGEAVGHDDYGAWFIECRACGSATRACLFAEEVAATWNRRADRWVPVSERLPEKRGHYVVTCENITYGKRACVEAFYSSGGWTIHESYDGSGYDSVIAWQPRPEPYEEGK